MKLTKESLKRIIKEELDAVMNEERLPSELSKAMPIQDKRGAYNGLNPGEFRIEKDDVDGDMLHVMTRDGEKMYSANMNKRAHGYGKNTFDNAGNPIKVYDKQRQRADIVKKALLDLGYKQVQ